MICCLILDPVTRVRNQYKELLHEIPGVSVFAEKRFEKAVGIIHAHKPTVIFLRCSSKDPFYLRLFNLVKRIKLRTLIVPIVEQYDQEIIKDLLRYPNVIDILSTTVESGRIRETLSKVDEKSVSLDEAASHFRGFMSFVGITPSLRERQILAQKQIGFLQNKSFRLAVDYFRKNPQSQIVMLAIQRSETLSSRDDEMIDDWQDYDLEPWEIVMFEAQMNYLQYWKEPIARKLLPITIPTIVRWHIDDLTPLPQENQSKILHKVGSMARRGQLRDVLQIMKIPFHLENKFTDTASFHEFLESMEKQMVKVEKEFPDLLKPPEKSDYEDFVPDKAEKKIDDLDHRMVFQRKK